MSISGLHDRRSDLVLAAAVLYHAQTSQESGEGASYCSLSQLVYLAPFQMGCQQDQHSCGLAQSTVLTDTNALIEKLRGIANCSEGDDIMLSTADVESLYTSIPIPGALEALEERLRACGADESFFEDHHRCREICSHE